MTLHRHTPLRRRKRVRATSPGSSLQRRKRIPPRSKKRIAFMPLRRAFVRRILSERPFCEAGAIIHHATGGLAGHDLRRRSCDVHERLSRGRSRRDETMIDDDNVLAVCRRCHDWIDDHPAASEAIGLLVRSDGSTSKTLPRRAP